MVRIEKENGTKDLMGYLQKTTPPKTLESIIVSAKLRKYRYVDGITTLAKMQIR
jgi:hypothetical protein